MSSSTSLPGARIGKYKVLSHIATGGMGTIYKARDEDLGRVVALKILDPELAHNPILLERFKREARHAARLNHKNIVTLYECGHAEGIYYLAMEYIEGIDLSDYIRRKGKLDPEEARRIILQACKALDCAYQQGVTHRDIKPSNFLLANDEGRCRVKLTDMGLARMVNEEEFRVTRAGTTVGTVDYMAPEQARDSTLADIRSDIYSLGCTFYHMLAGDPPFAEGGIGERVFKHMAADPPDLRERNPAVPDTLWTIIRRMLAKHPDDRFQTPQDLLDVLRSVTGDAPVRAPIVIDDDGDDDPVDARLTPLPESPEQHNRPDSNPAPQVSRPPTPAPERPPKRRTTIPELNNTQPDTPSDPMPISADQRQAASGQFERATEVIVSGGDKTYAVQLLLSCCKLDPVNLLYRKMLRDVGKELNAGKKAGWFGSLTNMPARGRLKAAMRAGEHRKVLDDGEELLVKIPGDLTTQLAMAEAAKALKLTGLAVWLLEEARRDDGTSLAVLKALGELYEAQKRFKQAIEIWDRVRALVPDDPEALRKIKELAVNDTLARGKFRR